MSRTWDVIVIGVGAMGGAACWRAALRGLRVLGLEQFEIGHDRGSSHGRSRVIRRAYFEDPRYVPLLLRTYGLWEELESAGRRVLYTQTGVLNLGPAGHECIRGARASAEQHGLAHETMDAAEVRRRWPVLRPRDGDLGVYEADGGFLRPERCVQTMVEQARAAGAEIDIGERVREWSADAGGVLVRTDTGRYSARRLIITAGAWLPELMAGLDLPLKIERQAQAWLRPADAAAFSVGRLPVFMQFVEDRMYYGIPIFADPGLKIARHHGGATTTPETVERIFSESDADNLRWFIQKHLPAADGPFVDAKICLYTNTPDEHFVIDRHPRHENVYLAGGFSGHGFKFAPIVGEGLAEWIETDHRPEGFELFSIGRF